MRKAIEPALVVSWSGSPKGRWTQSGAGHGQTELSVPLAEPHNDPQGTMSSLLPSRSHAELCFAYPEPESKWKGS